MADPNHSPDATARIGAEIPENMQIEPPLSLSTSQEAMKILKEHGVDAWRSWVADHAQPDE